MAVVAVNKNGIEVIGNDLMRCRYDKHGRLQPIEFYNFKKDEADFWIDLYNDPDGGFQDVAVELPKGSIKKLVGRELTWEDNPVKLL